MINGAALLVACDTCQESLALTAYMYARGECARCVNIEYCRCGQELDHEDEADPAPESSYEADPDAWDAWVERHPDNHPIWRLCEDCRTMSALGILCRLIAARIEQPYNVGHGDRRGRLLRLCLAAAVHPAGCLTRYNCRQILRDRINRFSRSFVQNMRERAI